MHCTNDRHSVIFFGCRQMAYKSRTCLRDFQTPKTFLGLSKQRGSDLMRFVFHSRRRAAGRSNNLRGLRPFSPNSLITPSRVGGTRLVDIATTTVLVVHMAQRLLMREETILSHRNHEASLSFLPPTSAPQLLAICAAVVKAGCMRACRVV